MDIFKNTVVKNLSAPTVVRSKKGHSFHMTRRKTYGLSFCISGQITYTMNEKTYVSVPGFAVLLPKGGTYTLSGDKEGIFPLINFDAEAFDCREITVLPLVNPAACLQNFNVLRELSLRGEHRLKQYSLFYDILSLVSPEEMPKSDILEPALRYISENLQRTDLSNTDLARQLGISEVYLRKLFAAHCGKSPKQYILDARIQKAKELLLDTRCSVTAISELCGFASLYHFCRVFKQRTGFSPTQFSNNNRVYHI